MHTPCTNILAGAIKVSKFTFVMAINADPQNPQQNLLLCSFNGSLTISDLVRLMKKAIPDFSEPPSISVCAF